MTRIGSLFVTYYKGNLTRLMDHEATRLQLDDFPTVRVVRLHLARSAA